MSFLSTYRTDQLEFDRGYTRYMPNVCFFVLDYKTVYLGTHFYAYSIICPRFL